MSRIATPFVSADADLITLTQVVSNGKASAGKLTRARALPFLHQGQQPQQLSDQLGISVATLFTGKKRYGQEGLHPAITENARSGQPRKVTQQAEAQITQLACSQAPDGRTRWTAAMINERLVKLQIHIDDESVRLALESKLKPWLKKQGCIGQIDSESLANMEDILAVYTREAMPGRVRL
ncbi:helix-turn-helix domain-containing protein [Spirosoma flavum]|uniref:Helix-turn-helix domain-containing protein n=1 Tax=Spirosoma flavum TaxID=2048557 RepID=A0ABW6AII7_9BACT